MYIIEAKENKLLHKELEVLKELGSSQMKKETTFGFTEGTFNLVVVFCVISWHLMTIRCQILMCLYEFDVFLYM